MNWTREVPSKPGFYWSKMNNSIKPVLVTVFCGIPLASFPGVGQGFDQEQLACLRVFFGDKITIPEEK